MTKTEFLIGCIKRSAHAYTQLEIAKNDCETVVDAEIERLVAECEEKITATDKKNIKKIAKAVASDKVDSLANEAKSLAEIMLELIDTLGYPEDAE